MRKDTKIRLFGLRDDSGKILRSYIEDGKQCLTLEGVYHHNMLTRAKNPNYSKRFPTYEEVSVSKMFEDFNYFAEWCNDQTGFGNIGWCLDKDILSTEKIYSEVNCVFVPPLINSYFTKRRQNRNLPLGVSWCESENCYKAYCSQLNGRNKTLGRFKTIQEASLCYQKYKSSLAKILIDLYKDQIDIRVVEKLFVIYQGGEFRWI